MNNDYLIVNKKILPDYLEKVIEARDLLARKEVSTVTEAVQKAGISRNTYYKYKDFVYLPNTDAQRHAVISLILKDEPGALSSLINAITKTHANILTISQALPIAGKANVLISLDITNINCTIDELTSSLKKLPYARHVYLDAVE